MVSNNSDPSIKALIVKIDSDTRDIVIEELDETHLLVDPSKIVYIKQELNKILSKNAYNPLLTSPFSLTMLSYSSSSEYTSRTNSGSSRSIISLTRSAHIEIITSTSSKYSTSRDFSDSALE
ncbi:hypothetical protein OGAPHI_005317 [Ogataea philodendri]|uniref:General transcription and DNA repair factor IIH subunit TFB5 n=1 Tax=Ogataea philodendri TaxID=1378263 RepID=A0A9P8P1Z6_9ASCO|nr:uncharacterized protein OGAPHI_005317 [Ogataea philodendri]KAH3663327.1 hypothetical protein OGAPHI_005317 [Ogataea philodendri]